MNRNAERMKYQSDKLSNLLCMLSIIFNVVCFVSIYRNRDVAPDVTIGADIIMNILFMMIVFLTSEKLKSHARNWYFVAVGIGLLQMLRIFWLPAHYLELEMLTQQKYFLAIICIIASGVTLLLAGINSSINIRILDRLAEKERVGGNENG